MKERTDGNCYEVSALMILGMGFGNDDAKSGIEAMKALELEDAVLVHGMVERVHDGLRHGHAWVEGESKVTGLPMVVAHANGQRHEFMAPAYYHAGKISDVKRYTRDETQDNLIKDGATYGPWGEEAI